MCGPPTSAATTRFTATTENPRPWNSSNAIGTSATAARMKRVSQARLLSQLHSPHEAERWARADACALICSSSAENGHASGTGGAPLPRPDGPRHATRPGAGLSTPACDAGFPSHPRDPSHHEPLLGDGHLKL